jgi:ribosome-binding ATPase YchF (GTP1/OBG family)
MVDVPDDRLTRLAEAVRPRKVVAAQVRVNDAPPGSRAQRIAAAREADVVLRVVRGFGSDPDPGAELDEIELDLALADLASVERRLGLVEREARAGRKDVRAELEVLRAAKVHLDGGRGLRWLARDPDAGQRLDQLFLVSSKPTVYLANIAEDQLPDGGAPAAAVRAAAQRDRTAAVAVSARLESELAELDTAEAAEYRATYGLEESGLGAVARAVWDAGGLVTFFTAGEPEVRAWPVRREIGAPVAAGVIHSDFEKHFIKAEVASVDELVAAGSMDALRASGKLRVEGRDYRIADGDVVLFRVGR